MENQTIQTPMQEGIPNQPKKRIPVLVIVLIGIVFLLVAFTAYLAYQNIQLKKQFVSLRSTSSPTSEVTTDSTVNWKTYTNTKYEFNIRYPGDWVVVENPINDPKAAKNSIRLSNNMSSVYISIFDEYGGACPSGYQKIMIDNQSHDVCISETGAGEMVWEQITFQKSKNTIELRAYSKKSTPEELLIPQILSTFKFIDKSASINKSTLGMYKDCRVYPRSSMNIPPSDTTLLSDRSEVRCEFDGKEQVLFRILDKLGFETAKNSVYRIWKDTEGYKVLLVDQNGAGSGEGNGKIILLKNNTYKLLSCFYYVPENFSGKHDDPLSEREMTKVNGSTLTTSDSQCNNFVLESTID